MRLFILKNFKKLLLLLALCVCLGAFYSLYSFHKEYTRQSKEFRDNFIFFVYQLEREAIKTNMIFRNYQLHSSAQRLESFVEQFDILWSRTASLKQGSLGETFRLLEENRGYSAQFKASMDKIDQAIQVGEYTSSDIKLIEDELGSMAELGRELSLEALFVHQDQSRLRRENLLTIYISAVGLIGLAFIVGVLVFIFLNIQNKRLTELGQSLEKKVQDRTRDLQENNEHLRKEIEERKRIADELKVSQSVADQANRAKTQFLANMSHELRTPLNAIIGFAEMMKQETWGPINETRYKGYVEDIHSSGQHLSHLLKEILDLTKIEAGETEIDLEVVTLGEILDDVQRLSRVLRDKNGGSLEVNADPVLMLNVDPTMIKQILLNFVSNAFKHAGKNCQVIVSCEVKEQIRLIVSDNGKGISEEDCNLIFEPFKQARNTATISSGQSDSGTGIGLTISKRLASLHEGEVKIESVLGQGTRAILILPITSLSNLG